MLRIALSDAGESLLRWPSFVRWGIRVDVAAGWWWLAAQTMVLWPAWWWMGRRMADGSDDPLGIMAICALLGVVWQHRRRLRASPRQGWMAAAMLLTVAATALLASAMPPLAGALCAVLALGCTLLAFLPASVGALPLAGLAVLALPLLSSLQFYAGFPLRLLTAEVSRWMLWPFFEVQRQAATLLVDGRLIIVDAPCSGVQMAWLGYFTACVVALWVQLPQRNFMLRLPFVGLLVLAGNVVRNSILVTLEARTVPTAGTVHEGIGLALLALVCVGIAALMSATPRSSRGETS